MHRLNGTEDGYHLRTDVAKKCLELKRSMVILIDSMASDEFVLSPNELNLLAHADAASDELLNVYHKIVLDIDK